MVKLAMHSGLSDESYFISRAKELEASCPDEARAWLLTAKTLFPRSFSIQFESYRLDREALSVKDSAAHLERLCREFPDEPDLWAEMRVLADALRCEDDDGQSKFLREVFCQLSTDLQHRGLSVIADRSSDTLEHCQLVLLLLNKFPNMVNGHGTRVVDLLLTSEKHAHFKSPLNKYRKFLVCDLLPSLLSSSASDLTHKQLTRLFLRTVEFYVCYMASDNTKIQGTGAEEPVELRLADPWKDMCSLCQLAANKLHWPLADVFTHKRSRDLVWQQLASFFREHSARQEDPFVHSQLVYCTVAVMLQAVVEYSHKIDPTMAPGSQSSSGGGGGGAAPPSLMLVEAFPEPLSSTTSLLGSVPGPSVPGPGPAHRRHRSQELDPTEPLLTVSRQVTFKPQQLTLAFLTGVRCWSLLSQNPALEKEFQRVWQHVLSGNSWPWFQSFVTDVHLYADRLQELAYRTDAAAAAGLGGTGGTGAHCCRALLQRMAAAFGTGDYQLAGELCLHILTGPLLPSALGDPAKTQVVAQCAQNRHLHFLSYTQADVSKYCIKVLTLCLQKKVLGPGAFQDNAVGHLIVLLQYDWPTEEPIFSKVVHLIRQHGTLTYPQFVHYVTCPDIVEEFVYLNTEHGGGLTFSLVPAQQPRQRTISTRGVDKGAREEFRMAMLQQIRRTESTLTLIGEFLTAQKDDVLRCLR
ncbi:integrator complex subunit 10-like isoform X1 [Amphibalanus amphitrite]|uniref:integrator complex subunit 10-like isoform X1 n=1 Tax=Amphibalanus amphitrite TaxID=1232801 RepID=UPI001C912322|nr:integrator complex subunit 10-like isoform X1 [Amphibalanus amphitrite]XP_043231816.1 integrator complex subunit 10-like isoform X1 [Amphibalanus amphitrite]XP_043231817.1 integrator complex subunit 10-like isoform X1 [Amphibalanus amphitrite]